MQTTNMEKIYKEYFELVYKYLICLTQNKEISEDLTQETFYKAITKIDTFKGKCKFSVWLCEIAKNLWINEIKKSKKMVQLKDENEIINLVYNVEDDYILKEEEKLLYKKISELDEETKRVFTLRLFGDFTFKEIGEIIGRNETWTRVSYYRGKQKIKESDKYEERM